MHKIWTVDDIKLVIDEIASRWNYPCNIKIEISKRATKRMGAFFYKRNGNNIIPIKFVFAYTLINGSYSKEVVREVIIHEYLHYYCDLSTNKSNGHNKFFKKCCLASGISDNTTFKYFNEENNNIRGKIQEISTEDSRVKVYVVPTNEELMIARDTAKLVK